MLSPEAVLWADQRMPGARVSERPVRSIGKRLCLRPTRTSWQHRAFGRSWPLDVGGEAAGARRADSPKRIVLAFNSGNTAWSSCGRCPAGTVSRCGSYLTVCLIQSGARLNRMDLNGALSNPSATDKGLLLDLSARRAELRATRGARAVSARSAAPRRTDLLRAVADVLALAGRPMRLAGDPLQRVRGHGT